MSAAMEHFREAEEALDEAASCPEDMDRYWLAKAQVHATLALAAVQIDREQVTA